MAQRFAPATPKFPHMLHGGDYNPEQWLDQPEVLEEDIRLFRKAHINCVSLGIFSWAKLEPEEGVYDFGWLDEIIDRLYANGIYTVLATPSGARPQWLARSPPEPLLHLAAVPGKGHPDRHPAGRTLRQPPGGDPVAHF